MQMSGDRDYSVYFGDMNLHVSAAYSQAEDLRARILLHIVLSEPLVIGDSHSLNSPMFRSLVADDDSAGRHVDGGLAEFLRRGDLRVARRDSQKSFLEIRNDHLKKNIDDVPPQDYAEWLDEVTGGHTLQYGAPMVSANFKNNFLRRLDRRLQSVSADTPKRYVDTLRRLRDWAEQQETLFYKKIRETYDDWRYDERNTSRETEEAVAFVERCASSSYHLALPQAIALAVTGPRNDELIELPATLRPTETMTLPYGLVNHKVWQTIPVHGVLEILDLDSRQRMLAEMAVARADGSGQIRDLMESIATFADELDAVLHRTFDRGKDAEVYAAMRRAALKARLTGLHDVSTGANGVQLNASPGDPADRLEDDFDIVSMPVAVTDAEPWLEPDDDAPKPNTRVVAGTAFTTGPV